LRLAEQRHAWLALRRNFRCLINQGETQWAGQLLIELANREIGSSLRGPETNTKVKKADQRGSVNARTVKPSSPSLLAACVANKVADAFVTFRQEKQLKKPSEIDTSEKQSIAT